MHSTASAREVDRQVIGSKLSRTIPGQTALMTLGTVLTAIGVYFFKFPNNFCFGGVTGLAVVLGKATPFSPATATFLVNIALLLVGFAFLGRGFGAKTVYVSLLLSGVLWVLEKAFPLAGPLTKQPVLEFTLAIFLPSVGSALLFNIGASGGGTDILAMILRQRTGFNAGSALMAVDFFITAAAFLVFDIQTGLFAFVGLLVKTFVINGAIESINLSKYFNIICDNPQPICQYINEQLRRGATVCGAQGAFTHHSKYIVFTALRRTQALQLRNFVKSIEPQAFIMISNSSEIIGKGFLD